MTYSASSYGTAGFTPDPSASDYVPYDSITEEVALGWCFADGVDKDAIEASLAAKIELAEEPNASIRSSLVMLAELAAFNAAYGVVKEFIGNGRDLADCFGPIGQMVGAKEDLKLRQEKNKKSLFA